MENLEGLTAPADYGGRCRRVIEYDPVGTGLSAKGTPAATVADAADELEAALKVPHPHVMCHMTHAQR